MNSVGEVFKQVREAKGLTLEEVASKTRIHPEFLKALEEGNFAKLPDQVFAKGFVRAYARSLGMDEEDTIRRFGESAGAFYGRQGEQERLRLQQADDERRRRANRKITVAAVGVALLGLVLLVSREQSAVFSPRPTTEPASSKATAPVPTAKSSGGPVATQPGGDSSAGTPPSPVAREESIPLKSTAIEPLAELPLERVPADKPPLVLDLEALELSWSWSRSMAPVHTRRCFARAKGSVGRAKTGSPSPLATRAESAWYSTESRKARSVRPGRSHGTLC